MYCHFLLVQIVAVARSFFRCFFLHPLFCDLIALLLPRCFDTFFRLILGMFISYGMILLFLLSFLVLILTDLNTQLFSIFNGSVFDTKRHCVTFSMKCWSLFCLFVLFQFFKLTFQNVIYIRIFTGFIVLRNLLCGKKGDHAWNVDHILKILFCFFF